MKQFVCYFLSLILCFSPFGANAYVCLDHVEKNTQAVLSLEVSDEMTNCHEQAEQSQQSLNDQLSNQEDCCDHECNTCVHFIAVLLPSKLRVIEGKSSINELATVNFSNLIQVIPTPPPIV